MASKAGDFVKVLSDTGWGKCLLVSGGYALWPKNRLHGLYVGFLLSSLLGMGLGLACPWYIWWFTGYY